MLLNQCPCHVPGCEKQRFKVTSHFHQPQCCAQSAMHVWFAYMPHSHPYYWSVSSLPSSSCFGLALPCLFPVSGMSLICPCSTFLIFSLADLHEPVFFYEKCFSIAIHSASFGEAGVVTAWHLSSYFVAAVSLRCGFRRAAVASAIPCSGSDSGTSSALRKAHRFGLSVPQTTAHFKASVSKYFDEDAIGMLRA